MFPFSNVPKEEAMNIRNYGALLLTSVLCGLLGQPVLPAAAAAKGF